MDQHKLLQVLNVPKEKVLGAFVFGSRAFGTANENSDWDFYVVIDGYIGPLEPLDDDVMEDRWACFAEGPNVDATVHEKEYWSELLNFHDVHAIVCQYSLPPHLAWIRKMHFKWELELLKLKYSTYAYTKGHKEHAKKQWHRGDYRGAKKVLVHALRYIQMATQIAETRTPVITNYLDANVYHDVLFNSDKFKLEHSADKASTNALWESIVAWYDAIIDAHMDKFKKYTNVFKTIEAMIQPSPSPSPTLHDDAANSGRNNVVTLKKKKRRFAVLEYIKKHNELEKEGLVPIYKLYDEVTGTLSADAKPSIPFPFLKEELSVSVTRIPQSSSLSREEHAHQLCLYQLNYDKMVSPLESITANECNGLVLYKRQRALGSDNDIGSQVTKSEEEEEDKEEEEWGVACLPFTKMFHFTGADKDLPLLGLDRFDWANATMWEMPTGISIILFYFEGQWRLSSSQNNFYARCIKEREIQKTKEGNKKEERKSASTTESDGNEPIWREEKMSDEEWNGKLYEMFWRVWKELGYKLPDDGYDRREGSNTTDADGGQDGESQRDDEYDNSRGRDRCYIFRMIVEPFIFTSEENNYNGGDGKVEEHFKKQKRLVLLGARDQQTFRELSANRIATQYGWEHAKDLSHIYQHALESVPSFLTAQQSPQQEEQTTDELRIAPDVLLVKKVLRKLIRYTRQLSLLDQTGVVLCDPNFNRIVLPSPQYITLCALRRFTNNFNKQALILGVVRSLFNEKERFCACYPEWSRWFCTVHERFATFCKKMDEFYAVHLHHLNEREFACKLEQLVVGPRKKRKQLSRQKKKQMKGKEKEKEKATVAETTTTTTGPNKEKEKETESKQEYRSDQNSTAELRGEQGKTEPTVKQENTVGAPPTSEGTGSLDYGQYAKLYWGMRRFINGPQLKKEREGGGAETRTTSHSPYTCTEARGYLTSVIGVKDQSMTKKLEEWLWKEENAILSSRHKTVRPRHATHRQATEH